jgi:hypothetical protein
MNRNKERTERRREKKKESINHFTGDFDLPKRICLNGLFLFFFDKIRHFLSKFHKKKCFLHFLKHRKVFSKNVVLQVFLSNLTNHLFLKF